MNIYYERFYQYRLAMEKELYLFIIWANARFMAKNLIGDIKKKFELFQAYEISWSKDAFESNLARFYGKKLPKGVKKAKEVGNGPFLALLVYDKNCQFSNGKNIAVSTAKAAYRQMLGKNLIHASDNMEETNENLLLLLGKNIKEIEKEGAFFIPKQWQHDLVGMPTWNSLEEALSTVRKLPFTKVTPYKDTFFIHSRYADTVRRVLNASEHFRLPGRHKYFIHIGKNSHPIYIRKVS